MADSEDHDLIQAAGAVVWRPDGPGLQIALVHRPKYDDWSYPKGKRLSGEHVLDTAVREVMEETGLRVALGRPLTPSVYQVGGRTKRVSYWAARCVESTRFVPGAEVDQVSWLPVPRAGQRLSYARDSMLLEEFMSGPAETTPLILLRHAVATRKSTANPGDLARPLDARGSADARFLGSALACYGRCRVISSAAERCLATVRPYAAAAGVQVEVEPAFTVPVGALPGAPATAEVRHLAMRRMADLASSGAPMLVCAHRENLPWLMDAAFGAFGARPPDGPPLGKGAFWVLQSAGGVLASAERHDVDLLTESFAAGPRAR